MAMWRCWGWERLRDCEHSACLGAVVPVRHCHRMLPLALRDNIMDVSNGLFHSAVCSILTTVLF